MSFLQVPTRTLAHACLVLPSHTHSRFANFPTSTNPASSGPTSSNLLFQLAHALLCNMLHRLAPRSHASLVWSSSSPPRRSTRFGNVAKQLAISEREVYEHADAVAYITEQDRDRGKAQLKELVGSLSLQPGKGASKAIEPLLLRPTLSFELSAGAGQPFSERGGLTFLGAGGVETNYQGVGWFLAKCWSSLQKRHPNITLTIIGTPPEQFAMCVTSPLSLLITRLPTTPASSWRSLYNAGLLIFCISWFLVCTSPFCRCRKRNAHCTWTTGTQYDGAEAEHGIVIRGYLGDAELAATLARTRLFIEPILSSTGVNTKAFTAFKADVPIVMTTAAAAGLVGEAHEGGLADGPPNSEWFVDKVSLL